MDITEVRIKLADDADGTEKLRGFCSVTLDGCFAVRDLKVIEGQKGLFVAMPSRKLHDRCPSCRVKNHVRARYCNGCGARLDEGRVAFDADGRARLHADIAHPVSAGCRDWFQRIVLDAYARERELAGRPGYVCRYDAFEPAELES